MTEYWVSQGNKWCDFCKIYIANNPLSIRTHELGQRHKDNVTKRLASMRKESAAKEKQEKEAAKALEQIEAKAKRSYQKDLAAFEEANISSQLEACEEKPKSSKSPALSKDDWEYDAASGYYYNLATGYYHDKNTGLYFSNSLGKWVKEEEVPGLSEKASKSQGGPPPGLVVSTSQKSLNPLRSVKGAPSSVAVTKRKRVDEKPKVMSKEEAAAQKAREAAKKRVEEREKNMLGLYRAY